jgi:hypothetical protein
MTRSQIPNLVTEPLENFESPADVVRAANLTESEKIEALRRWRQAEVDLERATTEGMEGPPRSRLDEINAALSDLGAPAETDQAGKR